MNEEKKTSALNREICKKFYYSSGNFVTNLFKES